RGVMGCSIMRRPAERQWVLVARKRHQPRYLFRGPFDSYVDAYEWVKKNYLDTDEGAAVLDWRIRPLLSPLDPLWPREKEPPSNTAQMEDVFKKRDEPADGVTSRHANAER